MIIDNADNSKKLAFILIIFVTLMVYANCLLNSFGWDDYSIITDNNFIRSAKNLPDLFNENYLSHFVKRGNWYFVNPRSGSGETSYRPVVTLTYFIGYAVWKLEPFGYHLTNLLFHLANVFLVYFFIGLLSKNKGVALICALFFSLHPVNSEPVSIISFREELLVFFFVMISLILYIKTDKAQGFKKALFYIFSLFSFFLGLFSKEMAASLPALLVLYDYFFVCGLKIRGLFGRLKRYSGFIIILLFYIWVRFFLIVYNEFPGQYPGGSFYKNLLTMPKVFATYIKWMFFPLNINFTAQDRPYLIACAFDFSVLFSVALILACIFLAIALRKSKNYSFAILWFFIALFPVANIIPITNYIASRYLYVPILGFCFLAALITYKPQFKYFKYLPVLILAFYAMVTFERNTYWKDNTVFHLELANRHPNDAMVRTALGNCYMKTGKKGKAIEEYKIALKIDPELAWAYNNLGIALGSTNRHEEAVRNFLKSIELEPENPRSYDHLGVTYARMKKWEEARKAWLKALEIEPGYEEAKKNLEKLEDLKNKNP